MSSIRQIMPEQHQFSLFFKDKNLEKEFRESYDKSVRVPLRYGIIISILSWFGAIPLIYFIIPKDFSYLALLTVGVIGSFFGFIILSTYSSRFTGYYHFLGACSNAWAGLYAIFLCSKFPNGDAAILPVLIFIIFFGWYMIRLRWIAGFAAALTYVIAYNLYILLYADLQQEQVMLFSFVAWITLIFALLAGRIAEHKSRLTWIQGKTIREQNETIAREKEASENLLRNMLPTFIADQLKENPKVIADSHDDVSVLFADLAGFTRLASDLHPDKVVQILNQIFSRFDALSEKHQLEKIKTLGDGYMAAGGLLKKEDHLQRIALLSLDMIEFMETTPEIKKLGLKIRIGIHVGPVVAGVIGTRRYTYDLWGDTVNLASRMESQGEVGQVTVSEPVAQRLKSDFQFQKRDLIHIKGKGDMQTFFMKKQ
ncbi:MAG: adenylate/guanylate cyclase domain-containing protein [Fluviicola sp.]